jgi:protein ImuB
LKEQRFSVETHPSHIPERSFSFGVNKPGEEKIRPPLPWLDRPSQILNRPQKIRALAALPDTPPVWIQWQQETVRVRSGVGPERIESEWWKKEEDGRDYFKLQLETGLWVWVYREKASQDWFLHGLWT